MGRLQIRAGSDEAIFVSVRELHCSLLSFGSIHCGNCETVLEYNSRE
jgi:hypothetical protein